MLIGEEAKGRKKCIFLMSDIWDYFSYYCVRPKKAFFTEKVYK